MTFKTEQRNLYAWYERGLNIDGIYENLDGSQKK